MIAIQEYGLTIAKNRISIMLKGLIELLPTARKHFSST
jgi:hypothetical protein